MECSKAVKLMQLSRSYCLISPLTIVDEGNNKIQLFPEHESKDKWD